MTPTYEQTFTTIDDDGTTVRIEWRRGSKVGKRMSPKRVVEVLNSQTVVGSLTVRYNADPNGPGLLGVREVRLGMAKDITPTTLKRFAWDEWLTVADLFARHGTADLKAIEATVGKAGATQPKRPGRRGHDAAFFQRIALRYIDLRARGNRKPVATIAEEEHVSRNTCAGWVKRCRELGHLPTARPGRAG